MYFLIGVIIGFFSIALGMPLLVFSFLVPLGLRSKIDSVIYFSVGSGLVTDIVNFHIWPWHVIGLSVIGVLIVKFMTKYFYENQWLQTTILIIMIVLIYSSVQYFLGNHWLWWQIIIATAEYYGTGLIVLSILIGRQKQYGIDF